MTGPALPLEGITVVAVEQAVAGPLATRQLADLGARVIKIERVHEGDFARHYDHEVLGQASHFVWLNRGKESVALDLKSEDGALLLKKLIRRAHVFLHNTAPGAVNRLKISAEELRASDPGLIVTNISGYGTGGPYSDRKAFDMLVQAESGLISVTGTPDAAAKTGIPTADIAAGMYASLATIAAIVRRERTGTGATIDVSMFDATAEWLGHPMYIAMYAGRQVERFGLSHASIAPYDSFPTEDGEILIGVQSDRGWRTLTTQVFGRPDLAEHPLFATNVLRVQHRQECDAIVAEHTKRWTTRDLDQRLAAAGVPAAQVNDLARLVKHPQLSERDRWREVGTSGGPIQALMPPMIFRDIELPMGGVPALGEHTDRVLADLGLTSNEIERLRAAAKIQ